ncbi:MAG: exopolyphosphatase, partial [Oscillospiraceae bacterium]
KGWILLGFLMDPRTGLGRFRNFKISNYQLMENLIGMCNTMKIENILENPDIKERVILFFEQNELFKEMILANSTIKDEIIITDLRKLEMIYTGNRFLIYSLFPKQNVSIWIVSGKAGEGCSCAVGHSIINRTSRINVGTLMLKYGGGGHRAVGTCQFDENSMIENISSLMEDMISLNR